MNNEQKIESATNDVVSMFRERVNNHLKEILAATNFANVLKEHFSSHPKEYSLWLKSSGNDYGTMCCNLVNRLNKELECVRLKSSAYTKIEKELKTMMAQMKSRMNETDAGNGFSKDVIELQNEIVKKQKQLERLEAFTDEDVSYTKNNLSALIDKVRTELLDLVPVSEPSDMEARKAVVF